MSSNIQEAEIGQMLASAAKAFTPGAPIDRWSLFSGRLSQVQDVINAISQRGRHVILYGERGVGKTSLARILAEALHSEEYFQISPKTTNCDISDGFTSLWKKIFREIRLPHQESQIGYASSASIKYESMDQLLGDVVSPDDIRHILQNLERPAIIVIDEIDRIQDQEVKTLLADTIKSLSDHLTETKLLLIGVADSVTELIGEHASIGRSLVQVKMPRMSSEELIEILEKGLKNISMSMSREAMERVVLLSQGLPEFTHSLGLYASQQAIKRRRREITMDDVNVAIRLAVEKTQQSILESYHRATSSPRKESLYARVLLACALAPTDILGYFTAAAVRDPLTRIMGKAYEIPTFTRHLSEFSSQHRGPILQKIGSSRRFLFRFVNPLMQPFVIAHGIAEDLVSHQKVDDIFRENREARSKNRRNAL
jgi:Cdc6-like AAA superfamily ATPase